MTAQTNSWYVKRARYCRGAVIETGLSLKCHFEPFLREILMGQREISHYVRNDKRKSQEKKQ
ncbi:MAG: hypothetical protein B6D41_06250 [Chloroflexi bacterium UTCFX4]|nr:MAG: hypothetical protein B6D41_06250 [Chloroflexi bacterium UTCFX4]